MEQVQFDTLLINPMALTEVEALELVHLSTQFPYSQVIHSLAARAAQDSNLELKEKLLHRSAVYCTDRSAFKALMTAPKQKRIEPAPQVAEMPIAPDENLTTDLHQQVLNDIASMHESKRLFELTIERLEKEKAIPLIKKESTEESPKKENDVLIEEIKSTKRKIKPEGAKQKEQIEIIDQFIKTQPSIPRPKGAAPVTQGNDLSEPSGQFGENIVSETLVEILLKQGKKEKAIEALKKLIWKFPQKKAYFAAQIEELRK